MSDKKVCAYPSDNHSDDILEVWHGASTPTVLCGFHESQGLNNALFAIAADEKERTIGQCSRCGNVLLKPRNSGAAGYATVRDTEEKICYSCSDAMQREDMATHDDFFAYLSSDGKTVTTWTGGELGKVTALSNADARYTPTGGRYERFYCDVRAFDGSLWHGVGPGRGMYVRLRRSKASARTA